MLKLVQAASIRRRHTIYIASVLLIGKVVNTCIQKTQRQTWINWWLDLELVATHNLGRLLSLIISL